jgi:hypothetical protein
MRFASDPITTAARFDLLREYMDEHVLTPGRRFICASRDLCRDSACRYRRTYQVRADREFHPAQLSHVGTHYDLIEAGHPLRILVIPMDTGGADEGITLEERSTRVMVGGAAEAYGQRNPHMKGTTNALRLALGRQARDDRSGEWLSLTNERAPVHLFACFAMANLRLCSAIKPGSTQSKGTPTMSENCTQHLAKTIEILEPTLCIVQGVGVARWVQRIVDMHEPITSELARVRVAGVETLLATFTHPSAKNVDQHWGRLTSVPYLCEIVQPTIRRARQELGLDASIGN